MRPMTTTESRALEAEAEIVALKAEIERLRADLARVQWGQLQAENEALRATEARLRAALTAIERVTWTEGERYQDMLMRCRKLASSACEQKSEDAAPADKR